MQRKKRRNEGRQDERKKWIRGDEVSGAGDLTERASGPCVRILVCVGNLRSGCGVRVLPIQELHDLSHTAPRDRGINACALLYAVRRHYAHPPALAVTAAQTLACVSN